MPIMASLGQTSGCHGILLRHSVSGTLAAVVAGVRSVFQVVSYVFRTALLSGDEALYEDETVSKQHPVFQRCKVQPFGTVDQARTPHFCAALLLSNGACLRFLAAVGCFLLAFLSLGRVVASVSTMYTCIYT